MGRGAPLLILAWGVLALAAILGGCSPAKRAGQAVAGAASAALGGGPQVAANVQAGRNNAQSLGPVSQVEQELVRPRARTIEQSAGETGVRAEAVQSVTVRNEAPPWVWLVAILAVGLAAASLTDEIRDRLAARKARGQNRC